MNNYDKLISTFQNGKCILFLGAGISINKPTEAPNWNDFVKQILKSLLLKANPPFPSLDVLEEINRVIEKNDFGKPEVTMQILKEYARLGDNDFFNLLDQFNHLLPNINHLTIAKLAQKGWLKYIITTNFDDCLEKALTDTGVPFIVYSDIEESAQFIYNYTKNLKQDYVHILKPHGTAKIPESIIMTLKEAGVPLAFEKSEAIELLLKNHEVFFIGYSGRDDDLFPLFSSLAEECAGLYWGIYNKNAINQYTEKIMEKYKNKGQYIDLESKNIYDSIFRDIITDGDFIRNLTKEPSEAKNQDSWTDNWVNQLTDVQSSFILAKIFYTHGFFEECISLSEAWMVTLEKAPPNTQPENSEYLNEFGILYALCLYTLSEKNNDEVKYYFSMLSIMKLMGVDSLDFNRDKRTWRHRLNYSIKNNIWGFLYKRENRNRVSSLTSSQLSICYQLLGAIFLKQGEYEKSEHLYGQSLYCLLRADFVFGLVPSLLGIAKANRHRRKFEATKKTLVNALYVSYSEGDLFSQTYCLLELAELSSDYIEFVQRNKVKQYDTELMNINYSFSVLALEKYQNLSIQTDIAIFVNAVNRAKKVSADMKEIDFLIWLKNQEPDDINILDSAARLRFMTNMSMGFNQARKDAEFLIHLHMLKGDAVTAQGFQLVLAGHYLQYHKPYLATHIYHKIDKDKLTKDERVSLLKNMAVAEKMIGNLDYATELLAESKSLITDDQMGNSKQVSYLIAEGSLLIEKEEYDEAIELLLEAYKLAIKDTNKLKSAFSAHHLGLAFNRKQSFQDAEFWFLEALEIERGLPRMIIKAIPLWDSNLQAATIASLGNLYSKWKKYEQAMNFLLEAYHRYVGLQSPKVKTCESWLAKIREEIGDEEFVRLEKQGNAKLLKMKESGEFIT